MDFVKCAYVARNASQSVQADWLLIVEQGSTHSAKFRNFRSANKRKRWSCDAFSRHWVLRFGLGRPSPSLSTVTVPAQLDGGYQAGSWEFSIKVRNDKWHETSDIDRALSSSFDHFDILQTPKELTFLWMCQQNGFWPLLVWWTLCVWWAPWVCFSCYCYCLILVPWLWPILRYLNKHPSTRS